MILVRMSSRLIEESFETGSVIKSKVTQGIPKGCKLELVKFDGNILSLYFSEPPEEVKELPINCERIE